jgi:hypothetical protein
LRSLLKRLAPIFLLACGSAPAQVPAQAPAQAPAQDPAAALPTLHVYTNLEQLPTLVLSHTHERLRNFDPKALRVSLDSGPPFIPTSVHVEADEPLSIALLIDANKLDTDLLPRIDLALAELDHGALQPHDRISVYAIDCSLIESATNIPPAPEALHRAVQAAIEPARLRKTHPGRECRTSMPLWDSLYSVTESLYAQPGRRVLIAITDGEDLGSQHTWPDLKLLTQITSVAVFGVIPYSPLVPIPVRLPQGAHGLTNIVFHGLPEAPFNVVCELSGGVELSVPSPHAKLPLARVLEMVRERIIVEYPRGDHEKPGIHSVDVLLPHHRDAYIRPTGLTIPAPDPTRLADPTTIPSDPAHAPVVGKRHILKPSP